MGPAPTIRALVARSRRSPLGSREGIGRRLSANSLAASKRVRLHRRPLPPRQSPRSPLRSDAEGRSGSPESRGARAHPRDPRPRECGWAVASRPPRRQGNRQDHGSSPFRPLSLRRLTGPSRRSCGRSRAPRGTRRSPAGEDAGTPVDLLLDPPDQVLDLGLPRTQRPAGHVDVERPGVGEPDADRRARSSKQRTATQEVPSIGTRLVDRALVGPPVRRRLAGLSVRATSPLTTTSIRSSGTAPMAEPARRYSRASASAWLEAVPGVVPVEGDEEHRAGRHEAPPRVQAAEPGGRVEAPVAAGRTPGRSPSGTGCTPEAVPAVGRSRKPQSSRA